MKRKETMEEVLERMKQNGARLFKDNSNTTPKLPSFDASAMSIKTWVDALIEVFSAYPNLSRGVAVSQVILSLREPLLSSFLMTVDADTNKQKNIQQLLTEFVDRTYVENSTVNAQMFARRSQLPDEPSESYGSALLTLGRNAFTKTLDNEQIMRRVFERFVSGLREPVGSRVRMQLPENYKQALQIASVVENKFNKGRVNTIENIRNRDINRPRYPGKVASNRTMPERRDRYNKRRERSPMTKSQTVHGIEEQKKEGNTKDLRKCFKCGLVGHIARFCLKKSLNATTGPRPIRN